MVQFEPPAFNDYNDDDIPSIDCVYRDPLEFTNESKTFNNGNFISILNFNIRSCRKNFASILAFLNSLFFTYTVLIFTESWLTENIDFGFDIKGYSQINLYRNRHGGGIKIYHKKEFEINVLDELTFINNFIEILTFYLIGQSFKCVFIAIYRPPSGCPYNFVETVFDIISKLPDNSKIILLGDVNLNLYNPLNLNYIEDFVNGLLQRSFFPIITKATKINDDARFTLTPYALLDHIWSNFKIGHNHISHILHLPITDHFPVSYIFNINNNPQTEMIKFRIFDENNFYNFTSLLTNLSFNQILNINDPNNRFNYFFNSLLRFYNSSFPIKKKKVKNNTINAPWVTPDLKKCIKKKYKLFNLLKRGLITKRDFNTYKNTLAWLKNKMRKHYFIKKFYEDNDSKSTWKNINSLLNRNKKSNTVSIVTDDGNEPKGSRLANYFNEFFVSLPHTLVENLPSNINLEFFAELPRILNSFYFTPTCFNEVYAIIVNLPNNGCSLIDIKPNLLKKIVDMITPFIVDTFNFCITNGTYPGILKVARVIPIYKSGSKRNIKNYRPISTLSSINKIFEKLTHSRISNFIKDHNILSKFQFGFRESSNTTLAIFHYVSDLMNTFNTKQYTIALYLDIRRAFDTINNELLLHKLHSYGFRGVSYSFIQSYLTNRKQYVEVNGFKSNTQNSKIGVPQGSVLGPLLFNIFINDVIEAIPSKSILYADDGVFYVTHTEFDSCVEVMKLVLDRLSIWLYNNKLIPNIEKTKLMVFTPKRIKILPDIYFNNEKLQWVNSYNYLGMIIDDKLTFSLHLKLIKQKLSKLNGTFYSISNLLPLKTLLTIYNSLVSSTLNNNIIIWGGALNVHVNQVHVLINRILRSIMHVRHDHNNIPMIRTSIMYKKLNILKFEDLYKLFLLKFLRYALYENHDIFESHFAQFIPVHDYRTRSLRINLPPIRLEIERRFTVYQVCKLYNEINNSFLEPQSKKTLTKNFKKFCINTY